MKQKEKKSIITKSLLFRLILPPVIGIVSVAAIILIFAKNPQTALSCFFLDTFTSKYYFGTMLNTATFFMIAGSGSAISIKSGNMNLGGEGQVYIGGFVGCLILNSSPFFPALTFILALVAAIASGAIMACISAILKELRGAKVLLTSFLISAAAIPLIDAYIIASKSTTNTNMLSLPYIQDCYKMPRILQPSPLSISFFVAIAVCIAVYLFMYKTKEGGRIELWGTAPTFAKYTGYNSLSASIISLAISGGLHGLTGFFAVAGTYHTCHKDFYVNLGWNALNTALVSASNPLTIIPISLLLALIFTSASRVSLTQGFGFDISGIVQGIILFSIAIPFAVKHIRKEK